MGDLAVTATATDSTGLTATATATAAIADPAAATVFGSTVNHGVGESWPTARARYDAAYGDATHKPVVRVYNSGNVAVADWGNLIPTDRPAVISFKPDPTQFLAGAYDSLFASWLAAAPPGVRYWVGPWHEPENPNKPFQTAVQKQQYRDMWSHFSDLVLAAGNPLLRRTMMLMDWTVNPASQRDYRDWYAPGCVDVLAWDQYDYQDGNGGLKTEATHQTERPSVATSRAEGVGYAVAEVGVRFDQTPTIPDTVRAPWMTATGQAMAGNGAEFVTWFNTDTGGQYVLDSHPDLIAAWRSVVTGS